MSRDNNENETSHAHENNNNNNNNDEKDELKQSAVRSFGGGEEKISETTVEKHRTTSD